jgi:hypothetical protein
MHVWSTHQPPATFSSRGRRTLTFSSVCAAAWGRNAAARRVGRSAARAWPCRALCGAASAWPSTAERACIPVVFMLAVYVSGAADPCMFYAYMPAKSVCRQSFARSRKTYKPKYDEIYIYIGKGSLPLCLPKKKKKLQPSLPGCTGCSMISHMRITGSTFKKPAHLTLAALRCNPICLTNNKGRSCSLHTTLQPDTAC